MIRVDIVATFRAAMREAGIDTDDEIEADGQPHRFHVAGDKAGTKNGTYCLYADGVPAGWFGTHRGGWETHTWCLKAEREISEDERTAHRQRMEEAERSKAAEEAKRKADARKRAAAIWRGAKACDDAHPYLQRKGVKGHGLKAATWRAWHQAESGQWQERRIDGALLVPMRDSKGTLHSLQAIFPERDAVLGRDKDFLPGGEKRGCYHAIGKPGGVILVAEGYATGASLHEATGHAVAVAFDCGNLKPVAEALRSKYPEARLVVCVDNDQFTEGNPGVTKGREAAEAAGAGLAVSEFADLAGEPTDFNDLAQREGAAKIKESIQAALQALGDASASTALRKPRSGRDSPPAGADAPAAKAQSGKRTRAGQEIRLCEIPSDAGAGLGCFEDLRGQANGSEFAKTLDQATRRYYGTAWTAFLEAIIAELDALPGLLRELQRKFEAQYLTGEAGGQAMRVSGRFALVAGAGELATKLGLTGWQPGEALQAAGACLKAWLSQRGGESNQEERAMLALVVTPYSERLVDTPDASKGHHPASGISIF